MKKFFSKPRRIVLCTLLSVVVGIALGVLIYSFVPNSFNLKADSDTKYYNSYSGDFLKRKYVNNNDYLSYNNGSLFAKTFQGAKQDTFTENYKKREYIGFGTQYLGDGKVYMSGEELFFENDNGKTKVDENCIGFLYNGKHIAYTKEDKICITAVDDIENIKYINEKDYVYYLYITDDKLFVITNTNATYSEDNPAKNETSYPNFLRDLLKYDYDNYQQNYTGIGNWEYNFYIYDLNTLEQLKSFSVEIGGYIDDICICKDTFVFYFNIPQCFYRVDFDENALMVISTHKGVRDLCSNGEKVYFVSVRIKPTTHIFVENTETNGIWELDITTEEERKLSNKFNVDDMLATENYLYCYSNDYVLPIIVPTPLVKGYGLDQIPIN